MKWTRGTILVEEGDEQVKYVRYVRAAKPEPKRNPKAMKTRALTVVQELPKCRVILHNMTKDEISKEIAKVRGRSEMLVKLFDNLSIAEPCVQLKPNRVESNLSLVKRDDTINVLIGNTTFFIAPSVLQLLPPLGISETANTSDGIDDLVDVFNELSVARPSSQQQTEYSVQIHRGLKLSLAIRLCSFLRPFCDQFCYKFFSIFFPRNDKECRTCK